MKYTVGQIIKAFAPHLQNGGVDPECGPGRDRAFEVYNEITRLLMDETAGEQITQMCFPVVNGCFTLDRRAQGVISYALNGKPGLVRSRNYRYQDNGLGPRDVCYSGCANDLVDMGDGFATHQDLPLPMSVLAYSDQEEDDATLWIYANDPQDGRRVTHELPIVKGTDLNGPAHYTGGDVAKGLREKVIDITDLRKTSTKGYVYVWGFDPQGLELFWLTTMAPSEEIACYRRYKIPGAGNGVGPSHGAIDALVSLRAVPLHDESDISLIHVPDAYKRMADYLSSLDSSGDRGAERWKNRAVAILERRRARERRGQHSQLSIDTATAGSAIRQAPSVGLNRGRRYGYTRR